jgi:hypothetical protein
MKLRPLEIVAVILAVLAIGLLLFKALGLVG